MHIRNIKALAFDQLYRDYSKENSVSDFCKANNVQGNSSWIMPQITSYVAAMPLVKTAEGQICSKSFAKSFGVDDWHKGLWIFCTKSTRGDLLTKQYLVENSNYCALVPLLLMPHKRFNGIKYSSWSRDGLELIVDKNLLSAMEYKEKLNYSNSEILEIQGQGLKIKTGSKAGGSRSPMTTHKLYGLSGFWKEMPWLAQVMYFQIWCAHPANRNELMILSWEDWDKVPDPLIDSNVLLNDGVEFSSGALGSGSGSSLESKDSKDSKDLGSKDSKDSKDFYDLGSNNFPW